MVEAFFGQKISSILSEIPIMFFLSMRSIVQGHPCGAENINPNFVVLVSNMLLNDLLNDNYYQPTIWAL